VFFSFCMAIGGCGSGSHSSESQDRAHTLTFVTADNVKSLDPALAFDTWSTAIVEACTRRLVDYDMQANIVPDLAERWEKTDGGKTYLFHLRPDSSFADGKRIAAQQFKAALERVMDPATASPGAGFYGGIAGLDAPDPATFVVRLKAPDPTLLNLMGLTFAAPLEDGQKPGTPSSSGPYMLERYDPGTRVVLTRNPRDGARYSVFGVRYSELPKTEDRRPKTEDRTPDHLIVQLRVEEPLQMTRFRNGEVDLLPAIPIAEYARAMADPGERKRVVQGVVNQTWYFGMNVTRFPWSDGRVRRAALLALNRERHARLAGAGQTANGILPPFVPGYDPRRKLPDRDLAEARRLLADAGFPGGIPEGRASEMWLANSDEYLRHAETIQSDLAEAGIPVVLRPATMSEYLTGYRTLAGCWYGGWYPDFPDAGNFMEPVFHGKSSGSNAAHYQNATVDALLDRAHSMPRGPAREAVYRRIEDILLQDLPWIPLYYEMETRYYRPGVTGVVVHPVWRQRLTGIGKG
jgi:oligopeptide transport system substrate-binding protein